MRFNIAQVLVFMTAMAVFAALVSDLQKSDIVWKHTILQFQQPEIPVQFDDYGRSAPEVMYFDVWVTKEIVNGKDLFMTAYARGWSTYRRWYYKVGDQTVVEKGKRRVGAQDLQRLNKEKWTPLHWHLAFAAGVDKCSEQIETLEKIYPDADVRSRIGYPRYWHTVFYAVSLILLMVSFFWFRSPQDSGFEKRND